MQICCVLAAVMVSFLPRQAAANGSITLQWVETNVSLHRDGKATLVSKIRWQVRGGTMHAFYYEGFGNATPHFDHERCGAVHSNGTEYRLEIKRPGGDKYDILLAGGARAPSGELTFTLVYALDFAAAGHVAKTKSDLGELVVFNWAAPQWDYKMEHQTLYIHYPVDVGKKEVDEAYLDSVTFRTERFMNREYLISYYGQEDQGKFWLTVRLHKDDLPKQYKMRVQQYVAAELLPELSAAPTREGPAPEAPPAPARGRPARAVRAAAGSRRSAAGRSVRRLRMPGAGQVV